MQPARLRRDARSDELPIFIQTDPEKQPVQPGTVIWNQQHRAGRFQRIHVVSTEAEQDPEQKAKESFHGFWKCIIWERLLQTKSAPVHGELLIQASEVRRHV